MKAVFPTAFNHNKTLLIAYKNTSLANSSLFLPILPQNLLQLQQKNRFF